MGASGWSYFVPYEEDVKSAFDKLQQRVFEEGDYYDPYQIDDSTFEGKFGSHLSGMSETQIKQLRESFEYHKVLSVEKSKVVVNSIEDLKVKNGNTGTHSILDIDQIAETDNFYRCGKVSDLHLQELFSTLKPTEEMVIAKSPELQTYRGRWLCTYVSDKRVLETVQKSKP